MKKILIFGFILLLTGCKNELVCTLKGSEENYNTEQKITFSFEDNKVKDVVVDYQMEFEDKETADLYMSAFENIEEEYEIEQNGNKVNIKSQKNYEQYKETKENIKEDLESNGYICK